MVQAIVEVMLSRVRRHRDREGLLDILLSSVLSIDVLDLLDKKAPMLRFDALFSQHENEVRAESKFIYIGPVEDVKDRFKEIDEKVKEIAEACQKENQRRVELQAQATIAYRMMLVFRNAAQYEEEMVCLNYLRKTERRQSRLPVAEDATPLKGPAVMDEYLGGGEAMREVNISTEDVGFFEVVREVNSRVASNLCGTAGLWRVLASDSRAGGLAPPPDRSSLLDE